MGPRSLVSLLTILLVLPACNDGGGRRRPGGGQNPAPPALTVSPGVAVAGSCVLPSQTDVVVLAFRLEASGETVTVDSLRVHASGTGDDAADVLAVRLVVDVDQDGLLGPADTPLGTPATYPMDDGSIDFAGLSQVVPPGAPVQGLVVYDLSAGVSPTDSFCAEILAPADVVATAATPPVDVTVAPGVLGCASTVSPRLVWSSTGDDRSGALFGIALDGAGDVNGDGFDDVLVGASRFTTTFGDAGKGYLYPGGVGGPAATASWTSSGDDQGGAFYGWSAAIVGDVDGDGFDDALFTAVSLDTTNNDAGKAYLYHGGPVGLSTTPDWTSTGDDVGGAMFGMAAGGAGDVNDDGHADVIVGDRASPGHAFVYLGGPGGLELVASWRVDGDGQAGSDFGFAADGAGDVNGDGYDDVVVGAQSWSGPGGATGKVYVYHGSAGGLSLVAGGETTGPAQAGSRFGGDVDGAGDVNGDGYHDVVVGAWQYDATQTSAGGVFVFLGGPGGIATTSVWQSSGDDQFDARLGAYVAGAGDLDGDGLGDVVAGALFHDSPINTGSGKAYVWLGEAGGLSAAPVWESSGDDLFDASFGRDVAAGGDTDGDGIAEVLVGAYAQDDFGTNSGKAFLYALCGP